MDHEVKTIDKEGRSAMKWKYQSSLFGKEVAMMTIIGNV